jgi:hypothetical protein
MALDVTQVAYRATSGEGDEPAQARAGQHDELPSGALRVRVYAGTDSITKRRHDLVEVIPAGPKAWELAGGVGMMERALTLRNHGLLNMNTSG